MSEDFDKEAERKRLREKYEAEREDREATERMSELLLQGATMTNKHCEVCGSPIFRYQGQEFCPSCQEERGGTEAAEQGAQQEAPVQGGDQEASERGVTQEAPDEGMSQEATREGTGQGKAGAHSGEPAAQGQPAAGDQGSAPGHASGEGQPQQAHPTTGSSPVDATGSASSTAPTSSGDINEARAALVRTMTNLARRAEQADDPRQAKELLAAAREAAETLARLRGN